MYKNLLLAVDLSNLTQAKYVVETAQQLTAHSPDAVYRVVTIIEPMDDSFISAFLPKNFDKSVVAEANKALHAFTQANFPAGAKSSTLWHMARFMKRSIKLLNRKM